MTQDLFAMPRLEFEVAPSPPKIDALFTVEILCAGERTAVWLRDPEETVIFDTDEED